MMKHRQNYKIFGPPGTGKTTTLLKIIKNQRKSGLKVGDIRLLGFSNATVNHLIKRAKTELKFSENETSCITTIHKFCKSYIDQDYQVINRSHKKQFKNLFLTDKKHWPDILEDVEDTTEENEGAGWTESEDKSVGLSLEFIKLARVSKGHDWDSVCEYYHEQDNFKFRRLDREFVKFSYKQYKAFKKQYSLIDFEDMLEEALSPKIIFPNYDVVMVDECQDLDRAQYKIIAKVAAGVFQGRGLPRKGGTKLLYLAGDDDQAIFGWKGSNVNFFKKWPCPEENKKPYKLNITYRLPKKIYNLANEIISHIPSHRREVKNYTTIKEEDGLIELVESLEEIKRLGFSFDKGEWIMAARAFNNCKPWIRYLKDERLVWKQKANLDASRAFASSVRDKVKRIVENWNILKSGGFISPKDYYEMISESGKDFILRGKKKTQQNQNTCSYDRERYPKRDEAIFNYEELKKHHFLSADINKLWYDVFKFDTQNIVSAKKPEALYEDLDEYNLYLKEVWERNNNSFPDAKILVGTIHGVKGMECPNVVVNAAWSWPSYHNQTEGSPEERDEEIRVAYVGVTRTEKNLFICRGFKKTSDSYNEVLTKYFEK